MITAESVKILREKTGCGMMDCKKALTEANGDMDKAVEFLREKGLATAAKKAGRIASEGIVDSYTDENVSVLLEVNSETDFVAKNDEFRNFVKEVAKIIAENNPADVEALLVMNFSGSLTVKDALNEKIATIGENLNIRRFVRYEGDCVTYIHGGGRIGVIAQIEGNSDVAKDAARDACMQVAAINPLYLDKSFVSSDDIDKEKEILVAQIKNDPKSANKPDNIIEKMVEGRISKYYEQNCLLQQEFVKDSTFTVEKYLDSKGVKILKFARLEKGEGLAKKEDNFADEVASMVK